MLLAGALFGILFILPLIMYGLSFLSYLVMRVFGARQDGYGARLALFWALLAASPVMLLWGLVAGFIGPGTQLTAVGFLWVIAFLWFWIAGLKQAGWGEQA